MTESAPPLTAGVNILLGEPRKAVIKLAIPIFLAQIAFAAYQVADMIWVSGLGPDSLSAVGFCGALFTLVGAVIMGIAVGGGTCIAQRIGASDKEGADKFASHMFAISFIAGLIIALPLYLLAEPLFLFMGAVETIDLTVAYARIIFLAFFLMLFNGSAMAVLRSEGDTKRAMYIALVGTITNAILDPIFIYALGMGVEGAAWATVAGALVNTSILCYWLFFRKITYVSIRFSGFRFEKERLRSIFGLGVPVALSQVIGSVEVFVNTMIVAHVGGTDGVAVYSTGFRFTMLAILPLMGIAAALVTVVGAAYGARNKGKLIVAYEFALRVGVILEGSLVVLIFFAAPLITMMFTWSEETSRLTADFITFFRISILINLVAAFQMATGSVFIGTGNGVRRLILTMLRILVFTIPCTLSLGIWLNFGLEGVWSGIVIGNWITAIVAYIWIGRFLADLKL